MKKGIEVVVPREDEEKGIRSQGESILESCVGGNVSVPRSVDGTEWEQDVRAHLR